MNDPRIQKRDPHAVMTALAKTDIGELKRRGEAELERVLTQVDEAIALYQSQDPGSLLTLNGHSATLGELQTELQGVAARLRMALSELKTEDLVGLLNDLEAKTRRPTFADLVRDTRQGPGLDKDYSTRLDFGQHQVCFINRHDDNLKFGGLRWGASMGLPMYLTLDLGSLKHAKALVVDIETQLPNAALRADLDAALKAHNKGSFDPRACQAVVAETKAGSTVLMLPTTDGVIAVTQKSVDFHAYPHAQGEHRMVVVR